MWGGHNKTIIWSTTEYDWYKRITNEPWQAEPYITKWRVHAITRRGSPLGVALPFGNGLMENGLKNWMAIKAFRAGDLSLRQLADALGKTKHATLDLLGELKIPFADYDLTEGLKTLDELFPA